MQSGAPKSNVGALRAMLVPNNSMPTAIQRMQQTPISIIKHLFISMYFASVQKCVTELNSVTNNPVLCAKLTVQHTTWAWEAGSLGLGSGDQWPAPLGAHERRSTAFQEAFPPEYSTVCGPGTLLGTFWGPGTAFPLTLTTVNMSMVIQSMVINWLPSATFSRPVRMSFVPRTHNSFGDWSFSAEGPRVRNSLPPHLRQNMNFARVQHKLKTFLFGS